MEWEAGVWEQCDDDDGFVVWSRHTTQALAERAARSYARRLETNGTTTGGPLSWSAGVRRPDGTIVWMDGRGAVLCEVAP